MTTPHEDAAGGAAADDSAGLRSATIGATGRMLRRRRGLPGSRAVVGGLLVTVALLATWWTATSAGRGPVARYVVAARSIAPGQRLQLADLTLAPVDLPVTMRRGAFAAPSSLVGRVTTSPLEAGDLVQASAVSEAPGSARERELSFVADADWAVGGTLRPGDRIDLLATYGTGQSSETTRVLAGIRVRRVARAGGDGIGPSRNQTLTVAIADDRSVKAAVNAARAGTITVVRSTGADPAADDGAYRPPGPGDSGASDRPSRSGAPTTSTTAARRPR